MRPYLLPALLSLLTVLPCVQAAQRSLPAERRPYSRTTLLALLLYFLADRLLPYLPPLSGLPQPWGVMSVRLVLVSAVLWGSGTWRQAGLGWKLPSAARRAAAAATLLMLAFTAGRNLLIHQLGLSQTRNALSPLYLLYLATLPGLAEEPVYRGLLQPQLNRLYGQRWQAAGARLGWGWLIVAVLFWAMHAWRPAPAGGVAFHWETLSMQLFIGLALGWMRERTGSLWPGVLAHNFVNLVWIAARAP